MKLIDYLSGDRRGGEARDLELEAQRDPLLAEALQGFEENPCDPAEALAELRRRILARAALETRRRHRRLIRRVAAAAVLLIAALTTGLIALHRAERFEAPTLAEQTPRPEAPNGARETAGPQTERSATPGAEHPDSPTPETGTGTPASRPEAPSTPADTLPARSSDRRAVPTIGSAFDTVTVVAYGVGHKPERTGSPGTGTEVRDTSTRKRPTPTESLRREAAPATTQRQVRYLVNGVERVSLAGLDTRRITDIAIHDEADGTTCIEITTPQQLPEAALAAAEPSRRSPLPDGNLMEFCEDVEPRLTAPVPPEEKVEEDLPFVSAETLPRFQGQDLNGFRKWVQERIAPSKIVPGSGIPGRVVVSFMIDTTGRLTQIRILQSPDRSLSDEVVRVLKQSPRWEPGRQFDRKVPVKFCIPVDFRQRQQPTKQDRNRD